MGRAVFIWHVCTLWDPWWHFLSCSLRWHFLRAAFLDDIFPPNSATQWCVWWAGDMVTCVRWNLCWWCYCDLFWWHFPPFRHLEFGLVCFWGFDTLCPVPRQCIVSVAQFLWHFNVMLGVDQIVEVVVEAADVRIVEDQRITSLASASAFDTETKCC